MAMIVVTGAAGFIGSNIVAALNARGRRDVAAVDYFSGQGGGHGMRRDPAYLDELSVAVRVQAERVAEFLDGPSGRQVQAVIHMGACSDTTQSDREFMLANNLEYTRRLWRWSTAAQVPFIYASSAATYGDGSAGYDDQVHPGVYKPLNLYGESKQLFDLWALEQSDTPPRWAGLKYFNVYGPREGHKERMASVAFHAFGHIRRTGEARLFESHRDDYPHGGQKRDFVYVHDAVAMTLHLLDTPASDRAPNGLYNVGTGKARTFKDLVAAVFSALGLEPRISYFPMPQDLRGKYQYFTEAKMDKLLRSGYAGGTHALEEGVAEYVKHLLAEEARGR